MPPWALRLGAVLVTGLSMVGSTGYALAHPKNPNAPLQPPVAEQQSAARDDPAPTPDPTAAPRTAAPSIPHTATPSATARASASALGSRTSTPRPTPTPRPTTPTPVPQITLSAGVRATALPSVSFTHTS